MTPEGQLSSCLWFPHYSAQCAVGWIHASMCEARGLRISTFGSYASSRKEYQEDPSARCQALMSSSNLVTLPVGTKYPNIIWMLNPSTAWEMGARAHSLQLLLSSLTTELLNYVLSFLPSFWTQDCIVLAQFPKKVPVSVWNLLGSLLLLTLQWGMRPRRTENWLMSPALWVL